MGVMGMHLHLGRHSTEGSWLRESTPSNAMPCDLAHLVNVLPKGALPL